VSRLIQTHTHMSDSEKSGAPFPAPADLSAPGTPPAEAAAASAASAPAMLPAAFGSFGANRGSGLLRGKRPTVPASASAPTPASGYKPTSVEAITATTESKNPFTG